MSPSDEDFINPGGNVEASNPWGTAEAVAWGVWKASGVLSLD